MKTLVAPIHSKIHVPVDVALIRRYINTYDYDASDEDIQWAYSTWCKSVLASDWVYIWRYRYLGSLVNQLPSAANSVIFILQGGKLEERTKGILTMVIDGKDTTPNEFQKIWQNGIDSDNDWRYNLDMTNDNEIKTKGF